jgi:hypothetical protein
MPYSQSPPLAEKEWPTAEQASSGRPARDLDTRSDLRLGRQPINTSIHSPHPSGHREGRVASRRPSMGRRMFRFLIRFSLAVAIGVGATLGWQAYGDVAREMLVAQAPMLAWLLSVSTTKSQVVAATSPSPVPPLEPLASNLDVVRRSVEQLAAKQEQMAQNIAALQAVEEDIRQKMSSAPPSPPQQAASVPQPKPPRPRAQPPALQSSFRPQPPTGPLSPSR